MSRIEVDSTRVAAASTAVQASAERIRTEIDTMTRQLTEFQANWKGTAASSFQQVMTDWRATQEQVHQALDEIRQALAIAAQQCEQAKNTAIRIFSR